jgi:hypothetical protein
MFRHILAVVALATLPSSTAFGIPARNVGRLAAARTLPTRPLNIIPRTIQAAQNDGQDMGELFGGFTAKQRLREEIESPFRKVFR